MHASTSSFCHNCGERIGSSEVCPHCRTENIFLDGEEWPFPAHARAGTSLPVKKARPVAETPSVDAKQEPSADEAVEVTETLCSAGGATDDRTETMAGKAGSEQPTIVATLLLKEGSASEPQKFDVRTGKTIVGREKAHLVLKSRMVSRRHGIFMTREQKVYFADNGSHNGTRLNGGEDLTPKKLYLLQDHDEIELGDVKYLVRIRERIDEIEEIDVMDEPNDIEPTRRA